MRHNPIFYSMIIYYCQDYVYYFYFYDIATNIDIITSELIITTKTPP